MNTESTIILPLPACRLIQIREVLMVTGLARSTIYKWMSEGCFPRSVKLNSRSVRWVENEVQEWIACKREQRNCIGA
ncbi:AlpA family transcriptional regulator [Vibrio coralliirubri]|uniref:helix-turn-helix transcriptional regulator n=1 Tax=Vibrio coralliirubri TaxID=1516159 RepID=UPI0009BDE489|nr:AlpA family transcriptional regulator [Vibrio coralliirubri]MCY9863341.1 AlpA family transcriptional regulator [Vibrio coralliirubri]